MSKHDADRITIAIVDDEATVRETMMRFLHGEGYRTRTFADAETALQALRGAPADIVITDLRMPGLNGIELLARLKERRQETEVILITAYADKDAAVQALKLGAYDFFEKPVSLAQLGAAIKRTVRYQAVVRERDQLSHSLSAITEQGVKQWGLETLKGNSRAMKEVFRRIRMLQNVDRTSVLLLGESGTGKELLARAIHYGSARAARPFVPINCSAVPGELAESELFGHVKGSFTGATSDRKGCFARADSGTLFLDEIGDMDPALQAKLLRVLEDGAITPVGGAAPVEVDVRIVAATNADLEEKVGSGSFREDLFYRLARYAISVPPLRERRNDIPLLIEHFVPLIAGEMGLAPPPVAEQVREVLMDYPFPGNVRELRNMLERALIESGGQRIEAQHIVFLRTGGASPRHQPAQTREDDACASLADMPLNLAEAEERLIRRALSLSGGNMSEAARMLGINRTKLYRRLQAA